MVLERYRNSVKVSFLGLFLALTVFMGTGCIRLQTKAGYWYQGADDAEPVSKQIELDTQDIVQRDRAAGNITY